MQRIDAHHHFWKFDPVRDNWITGEMHVLQNDFLPADLQALLQQERFDGSVLVQSAQTEEDNEWMLQLASGSPFVKGIVGWVDLQAENVGERLDRYHKSGVIKGFRHILQGEEDRGLMVKPNFMRGIAALKKYDFTFDILIHADQLPFAVQLAEQFPEQPFVLDHMAKPAIKLGVIDDWKEPMMRLAKCENVYCKVSGMVTEADWQSWKVRDFDPYLDVVTEAFGPGRLMYGSDWPVCLLAASYQEQLSIVSDYFSSFSVVERERIFGLNAVDFYKLS